MNQYNSRKFIIFQPHFCSISTINYICQTRRAINELFPHHIIVAELHHNPAVKRNWSVVNLLENHRSIHTNICIIAQFIESIACYITMWFSSTCILKRRSCTMLCQHSIADICKSIINYYQ